MEGKQGVRLWPPGCRALLIAASVFKKKKKKKEKEKLRPSRPDCHSVFVISNGREMLPSLLMARRKRENKDQAN